MSCSVVSWMGFCDRKRTLMGKLVHDPTQLLNLSKQEAPGMTNWRAEGPPLSCNLSPRLDCMGSVGSHTHTPTPFFSSLLDPFPILPSNFHNCPPAQSHKYVSAVLIWKDQFFHPIDENQIMDPLAFSQPIPFSNCYINIVMAASKTEKHFNWCISEHIWYLLKNTLQQKWGNKTNI